MNEPENHGVVQDLLWVWRAPPLMALYANWRPQSELGNIDLNILSVDQWATLRYARTGKLGAYFEALVCALIDCSDHYKVLARGVIIQGSERTLGELDVVIQHRQNEEIVHLELALKFYLQVPDPTTDSATWIGPGLRDFLRLKYHHLDAQQLTLPARARAVGAWPEYLPFPDRSLAWVTGRLYYSWPAMPIENDALIQANHVFKHWLTLSDFKQWQFNSHWLVKGNWLSGAGENHINKPPHGLPAQCFGRPAKDPDHNEPDCHWFIVPDDWPEQARIRIQQRFG